MPPTGPPKGLYGPGERLRLSTPPPVAKVVFRSEDPEIYLACETTGANPHPPEPHLDEIRRAGAISLTPWTGQAPYRMDVGVRLDGFPDRSVEPQIVILESLAEVQPGRSEPPTVTVEGAVPKPHPNLKWKVESFDQPAVDWLVSGERCRYETVVHLVQNVTDRVLIESLRATSKSKGVKARSITVRAGEDWLFEVARRAYNGDSSRAGDLATANNLHLGKKLTPGTVLRLP